MIPTLPPAVRSLRVLAAAACVLASACRQRAADTTDHASINSPPPAWGVTLDAAGPVRFGMTASEASSAAGGAAANSAPADSTCRYWVPEGAPAGLRLMMENGIVVRAEVDSAGITTVSNLGVGSPVDSVVVAIGPSLQVSPHKYRWEEGWRYLSVGDDSVHRLIFTVDSHVVRSFRAGVLPAVEYVEGCS